MKNLIKKLQGKNTIILLKDRSSKIFNIFTETVNQLIVVNSEIETEKITRSEQIETLKDECEQLETVQKNNQSMINKISSFLKN